jgi:glycosyltransferase involved in cell wall biosynthesis
MRVLLVHNFYQQPGGEDEVFRDEGRMLRAYGHTVIEFTVHNNDLETLSKWSLARKTFWNDNIYHEIRKVIRRDKPDIAHFHNTFPLVSPAAYYAAHYEGVSTVQTLHNYRLICPKATLYRQERVCEDCIGRKIAWPAILHSCYRDSALASGLAAAMVKYHSWRGTWANLVDVYIALTNFSRRKLVEGGLPKEKVVVKPNFVLNDPGLGPGGGGYVVFVGRLVSEKGVQTLLQAWRRLETPTRLMIVGDGPLRDLVKVAARADPRIEWLGWRHPPYVQAILASAEVMIFPSQWYEGFPRTIIESFATGTPVVAARIGALSKLIRPELTGHLFNPGDPDDLITKIRQLVADPRALQRMRSRCRQVYLKEYSVTQNYPLLMKAYQRARRMGSIRLARTGSHGDR